MTPREAAEKIIPQCAAVTGKYPNHDEFQILINNISVQTDRAEKIIQQAIYSATAELRAANANLTHRLEDSAKIAGYLSHAQQLADDMQRERDEAREAARELFGYSDGRREETNLARWPWLKDSR